MSESANAGDDPLLRVEGLKKYFDATNGLFGGFKLNANGGGFPITYETEEVRAVDGVSFEIEKGETLGLVGESGCGKSTLGRTILRLINPTDGDVYFRGENVADLGKEELRQTRASQQMIFQDPQASLNPRLKVGPIVEEPMQAHGIHNDEEREAHARELLEAVGLDPQHYNRYPHEFSGGQRQRINLARALSVDPDFIVCDEPTSALDASIQAQVLNTMRELQAEFGLTYLFISHDLSVIRHISDRVAVMYLGKIVELGEKEELFENPKHPYTKALLSAIPIPDPAKSGHRNVLEGDVPDPIDPPSGCRFRTRCPELIAPLEYDLGENEWNRIRRFVRAVDRRTFDPEDDADVRRRFFEGVSLSGEAKTIVDDAVARITADKWDEAATLLTESFAERSICAREIPAYEVEPEFAGDSHYAACHLYADEALDVD